MKRVSGFLIALVFCFSGFKAFAEPSTSKIGVVDLQKIMQTSSQVKTIQEKLKKDFQPRQEKLVAQEASIKQDKEKLNRDATVLSANEKKALESKIAAAEQDFAKEIQKYQQEINTANSAAMEELYNKIHQAIAK